MAEQLVTEPPRGLALFIRRLRGRRNRTPFQFAKLCADHGLRWVAIAAIWHDLKGGQRRELAINSPQVVADYSQAFSEAGVKPHIWGYPWHDRIQLFIDQLSTYLNPYIVGILLDPELGLKKYLEAAKVLFHGVRALNPYLLLGLSSYGLPRGHRTFPFSAFAEPGQRGDITVECDYGCPQLYDLPVKRILEGLDAYDRLGFDHIVPAFGTYRHIVVNGRRKAISLTSNQLENHLCKFITSAVPIPAAIGWAENFMTPPLWDVLDEWADIFDFGGTIQSAWR